MSSPSYLPGDELGGVFARRFPDRYLHVTEAEGHRIRDAAGNEYVDMVAGNQNVNLGYSVPELAEAAAEQMERLPYVGMHNANDPAMEFTERIAEFTPDGFEHTWVVNGGSLATESALKMAHQYHRERGNERKHKVVGRRHNYHGSTAGAMAMNGYAHYSNRFEPLYGDYPVAPSALGYRCPFCDGDGGRACGRRCADAVERIIVDEGPDSVAAFVTEPVCGTGYPGGIPHDGYFERVREICDEYDVLFVVDEVMTGFGRTGENFGIEHWDVTPDIIAAGKGMGAGHVPLGGTMPHRRVVEVFEDLDHGFWHGHTDAFHPVTAAVGRQVLDLLRERDVVANARTVGSYLGERLLELYDYDMVGDVRGKGMQHGVEFVGDPGTGEPLAETGAEFRSLLLSTALDDGLLAGWSGAHLPGGRGDAMPVTPPLTVDEDDVDGMMTRLHETFATLESELALA